MVEKGEKKRGQIGLRNGRNGLSLIAKDNDANYWILRVVMAERACFGAPVLLLT